MIAIDRRKMGGLLGDVITTKAASLKRAIHPMPDFVASALREHKLEEAYEARPPYQRNDYIGWILKAKLDATRQRRLHQMLTELKDGTLYMNMPYQAKH